MGQNFRRNRIRRVAATLAVGMAFQGSAWAFDAFTIREIRAEGLKRIEIGTVLTYLPLSVGDQLNGTTSTQAITSLYQSGLFQDVQLLRDGDALVIKVKERPSIASFKIEGNEKIGGDDLKKSLKDLGLVEGELFKRSLLDGVEQELQRQYLANGFYDVSVDTQVTDLPNNRVDIHIKVVEGPVSHIKEINIIGNKVFPTDELLKQLKLQPSYWIPFIAKDKYSKQQLGGDLESLSSYYQDRGYLQFNITSVQVSLSPDKKDIYITLNVEEGEKYKVKSHRFSGETVLNEVFLERLISTHDGDQFSRKEATESSNRIEGALADVGYAFAKVTPLPEVDEKARTVGINYFMEPGKRAYIRHINFVGNAGTNDETLRREMRQLEAAPFSKSSVERSRQRLARLPYIESAEVDTKPVAGSDDLVDIEFKVKERAPGAVQFGVGYSGAQGFLINASVVNNNFLGTGDRVAITAENSVLTRVVNLSWTDPYFTEDGISQTISTSYRRTKGLIRYSSGLDYDTIGADLTYGIPLSEFMSLRLGGGISQTAIQTFPGATSDQVLDFVINNGVVFNNYQLKTGIGRDTRNKTFFANRGSLTRLTADITIPGSDIEYYNLGFEQQLYLTLPYKFFVQFNASAGMLGTYGTTHDVPPYENYFAGGPTTVRGYRDGELGPRDTPNNNPFGGRLRTTSQSELVLPLPLVSDNKITRLGVFYDVGDVFAKPSDFRVDQLRMAYGLAFSFFTPILGLLDLSYAFPLNPKPGDETAHFQISFGQGF